MKHNPVCGIYNPKVISPAWEHRMKPDGTLTGPPELVDTNSWNKDRPHDEFIAFRKEHDPPGHTKYLAEEQATKEKLSAAEQVRRR